MALAVLSPCPRLSDGALEVLNRYYVHLRQTTLKVGTTRPGIPRTATTSSHVLLSCTSARCSVWISAQQCTGCPRQRVLASQPVA